MARREPNRREEREHGYAPRLRGCLSHSGLRYLRTMPLRSQERDLPASASASEGVGLGVRLTAAR